MQLDESNYTKLLPVLWAPRTTHSPSPSLSIASKYLVIPVWVLLLMCHESLILSMWSLGMSRLRC